MTTSTRPQKSTYSRRQKKVPRSIRTTGARLKKTGGERELNGN